jgi:DNA-binding LytR/AlgR family response regulator
MYRANRLVLIEVQDALRLESNDHYTWIVTSTDRYLSNLSLSDLEERLDPAMCFRCHRSHIVNLRHVTEIERDGDALHLVFVKPELARVPVSRAHVRELREIVFVKSQSRCSRGHPLPATWGVAHTPQMMRNSRESAGDLL